MNDKVLFLDLETTGLNPKFCSVLEVAAVVVDPALVEHGSYEQAIFHNHEKAVGEMDRWCRETHTKSGLLDDVARSTKTLQQADQELANFIVQHFGDEKAELAGNSVHFDLAFIKEHMPHTAAHLSHRVQDVSGAARLLRRFTQVYPTSPDSGVAHRAMADVCWSIDQLRRICRAVEP